MSSDIPVIQILEKSDYTKQHIVSLPNAVPYPPLSPSSIRIRSTCLSLTTNNFTYARLGEMLGWFNIYLLPPSTPSEFSDPTRFGRIASWGYGEVIESTFDSIPKGMIVWGFLPIGTLAVDQQVSRFPGAEDDNQILNVDPHRKDTLPAYNWYLTYAPGTEFSQHELGWSSIRGLFGLSWLLNRFSFPWDDKEPVHPAGVDVDKFQTGPWSKEDSILKDAVVVLFAPGGKTAASFAHQVRHARPADAQPRKVIGVTSTASKPFVDGTGFYDTVVLYDDIRSHSTIKNLGIDASTKVVLFEFGARGDAVSEWYHALKSSAKSLVTVNIGGEPTGDIGKHLNDSQREGRIQANASGLWQSVLEILDPKTLNKDLMEEWKKFVDGGAISGVKLQWGEGMDDCGKGWDALAKGEVGADKLLVYKL
ncbi:hypothetical protein DL95DRAFT_529411 [Leptodontidium sp. 2 PMI_412]|nr:hypothetical protein DL95DRAFT_529411 [Leptodontidium sp. 2 PMI_412]